MITKLAKVVAVATLICGNFALGYLTLKDTGSSAVTLALSIKASAVLGAIWSAVFLFALKRTGMISLWLIAIFPNPVVAMTVVLLLACFTGGGCL